MITREDYNTLVRYVRELSQPNDWYLIEDAGNREAAPPDMSERFIDMGERKWKTARETVAVRWRTSQKGNPYTTFRGFAIVVCQFKEGTPFRYMVKPERADDTVKWEVYGKFATQEEAKDSAIAALMKGKKQLAPDETVASEDEAITFDAKRKIIL